MTENLDLTPSFHFFNGLLGGGKLLVDPETETFTNSDDGNALLKREYREPWVMPDPV